MVCRWCLHSPVGSEMLLVLPTGSSCSGLVGEHTWKTLPQVSPKEVVWSDFTSVGVGDDYSFRNSWINWRRLKKKNHQSCLCWCRSSTEHHVSVSVFTLGHATVSHTHTVVIGLCVCCCAVHAVTESVTGINSATSCLTARREVASSLATLWNKPKQSRIEWRTWMHF